MTTHLEKLQFSERLHQALAKAGVSSTSPTSLSRKFNMLYPEHPISVQAVRRWLEGTSIPAQDKLVVLASWLKVSPEWLRFGDSSSTLSHSRKSLRESPVNYDARTLATLIELLSEENQQMVIRIITALLESEGKPVHVPRK